MKKRILSALLVLVMVVTMIPAFAIASTAATTRDKDWYAANESSKTYTIQDAGDLLGFSDLLASGTTFEGWTLTLGTDITLNEGWTASATAPENGDSWASKENPNKSGYANGTFSGTFDGNGKTISGIYLKASLHSVGIFGSVATGATVKNLVILNSYVAGKWGTGGIFGDPTGTNTIENVYADIDVACTGGGIGGFIGRAAGTNATVTIKNCVFAGTVTTSATGGVQVGGFVGQIQNGVTFSMESCAFYGAVTVLGTGNTNGNWDIAGLVGQTANGSSATIKNCISAGNVTNSSSNSSTGAIYGRNLNDTITIEDCIYTYITCKGEERNWACQGAINDECTLTTKVALATPTTTVPTGFSVTLGYPRPTSMLEMTSKIIDNVEYAIDTTWYTENTSATSYNISTPSQLLGFSKLLSDGTTTFAGKTIVLTADINVNTGWTAGATAPVNLWANVTGSSRLNRFCGTFDGNGKTISGIYLNYNSGGAGIFGNANGATVKNLVILNSYVFGTWGTGGIFGEASGAILVENVYADIDVAVTSDAAVGGFIGRTATTDEKIIRNCVYIGTVTNSHSGAINTGGFVGLLQNGGTLTFENVAFYGTVHANNSSSPWNVGGILGNNKGSTVNFTNCISAGTVMNGDNVSTGAILGRSEGTPTTTSTNCLYTLVKQGTADTDRPLAGVASPSGCTLTTKEALATPTPTATVPAGFTAMPEGYPMPITLANTVWAQSSMATSYGGYQKGTSAENDGEIRLIGVVDVATDLESEFSAVGFDIEMILGNGNTWTNKTEGTAPVIYNLYTSVETDKGTATAEALEGDYIFVATVNGINSEYTGDITFVVKTFHDDANGNRVYDDIHVIAYQAAANA